MGWVGRTGSGPHKCAKPALVPWPPVLEFSPRGTLVGGHGWPGGNPSLLCHMPELGAGSRNCVSRPPALQEFRLELAAGSPAQIYRVRSGPGSCRMVEVREDGIVEVLGARAVQTWSGSSTGDDLYYSEGHKWQVPDAQPVCVISRGEDRACAQCQATYFVSGPFLTRGMTSCGWLISLAV